MSCYLHIIKNVYTHWYEVSIFKTFIKKKDVEFCCNEAIIPLKNLKNGNFYGSYML